MDTLLHIALPVLLLLALKMDTRTVVLLSPLTILPDFDAAFGLHRAAFHSFGLVLVFPLALIAYAKLKRPDWLAPALIVQFYLASHIVLDLGGVAFFWPVFRDQFFFDPEITFNLQGGINFAFHLDYGTRPLAEMGTTDFLSETGFALLFLGVLLAIVYRREALSSVKRLWRILRDLF